MKPILFLLLMTLVVFASCQQDDDAPATEQRLTASINGQTFQAEQFVAAQAAGVTSLNGVKGTATSPESITLNLENLRVGTFTLSDSTDNYAVYNSATDEFVSLSGTVEITSMEGNQIVGTFAFTAQSVNDTTKQVVVDEGEFRLETD